MRAGFRVWDLPTRLSHWALVVLLLIQFASGLFGLLSMQVHLWGGYALLVVLLFRVLWGLCGSDSARFTHFLRGPRTTLGYLRRLPEPGPAYWPGHNPVGAWSILLLLGLSLAQSFTGLFAREYGGVAGALADRAGRELSRNMNELHQWLYWLLLLWILIHVGAALFHLLHKRENLIVPIFSHGRLPLPADPGLRFAGAVRAWLLMAISLAVVGAIIVFG